jgi:hypothetical protein
MKTDNFQTLTEAKLYLAQKPLTKGYWVNKAFCETFKFELEYFAKLPMKPHYITHANEK